MSGPYLIGRCLYGADETVCAFVSKLIDAKWTIKGSGIGVVSHGALIGGVAYADYTGADVRCSIAGVTPKWLSRDVLKQIFFYPFDALNCRRVTVLVSDKNARSQRLARGLGFTPEGLLREGMCDGSDALVFGMLKNECRWIKE
jgi:RimJ/RimL family protein N-acetyltransferase